MASLVPKILYKNRIAEVLDEVRYGYGKLARKGYIYGLMAIDQDAKIIAIDSNFNRKLNYWDLSSIGAALYGVARQGQDFFDTEYLNRATIIYNNLQIFVKSIGEVNLKRKGTREILIVLLASKEVNIGIMILQLVKFALKIKEEIEKSQFIVKKLEMTEQELKELINSQKKEIFNKKIST